MWSILHENGRYLINISQNDDMIYLRTWKVYSSAVGLNLRQEEIGDQQLQCLLQLQLRYQVEPRGSSLSSRSSFCLNSVWCCSSTRFWMSGCQTSPSSLTSWILHINIESSLSALPGWCALPLPFSCGGKRSPPPSGGSVPCFLPMWTRPSSLACSVANKV